MAWSSQCMCLESVFKASASGASVNVAFSLSGNCVIFEPFRKKYRMYALAVCNPPLGSTTILEQNCKPIRFTAILELSEYRQESSGQDLIVELWYGEDGSRSWGPARFKQADTELTVLNQSEGRKQRHFVLDLHYNKTAPLNFSIRFKFSEDMPWLWAREHASGNDGRILFKTLDLKSPHTMTTFESIFQEGSNKLSIIPACSRVPEVSVWNVTAPCGPQTVETCAIGVPVDMERFYALVKVASPWMGPRQGSSKFAYDRDALIAGYVRKDGKHVVIMGVSALDDCNTYIIGDNLVRMKTRNDGNEAQTHKAIIAMGYDFKLTVDAAFYRAREMVKTAGLQAAAEVQRVDNDPIDPQWRQDWFDGLAYCTWNGLGRELTEDRILAALQELTDSGIKVSALIIDDNWQTLINRKWDKFEADPVMFPRGLKATVTTIKQTFPHIKHVAVWHAMFGYWDGVAPGGWVDSTYKCATYKWHGGHDVRLVTPEDASRVYDDFYSFLSSCGIDGVKTDVQAALDELDHGPDRQPISRAYQDAFKVSSLKYFGRKVIYCMAMQPFIYWHSLISQDAPPAVFRNSDDFFPDIPSSHNWHVFANVMNTIFTGRLNGLPDWDMFQSSLKPYGPLHAAARCISGGPIYITDTPGSHDMTLINHMSAVTPRGNTVILRPTLVAQPIDPFVEYNGRQLLKVGNIVGTSESNSLLAVFNTSELALTEIIGLQDFPSIDGGEKYAIRAYASNVVVGEVGLGDDCQPIISLTLQSSQWEIFTATKLVGFSYSDDSEKMTYLGSFGLTDKMAGAAALLGQRVVLTPKGALLRVTLKALGVLGLYISDLPERKLENMLVTIWDTPVPVDTVRTGDGRNAKVLYVDIKEAWFRMGLQAGWSSQVEVTLRLD